MNQAVFLNKAPQTLRHELKYNINHADDRILSHRLKKLFRHDKNADSHGSYRVSSLYFDTPYDNALKEKLDGVKNREKFRLRYYGDDIGFIRLEKKLKTTGLCAKQSAKLTLQQAQDILTGSIEILRESGDPLFIEFYSKLKGQLLQPKTIVRYYREAFLYEPGNVRITIDRKLHTEAGTAGFFDPQNAPIPVHDGVSVLEVKYDAFLPEIVRMAVQVPDRRQTAYSKYAISRRHD